jgi:CheY-like chemotaxis protein
LAPDLGRVKADPVQFEQVLINLAVNAKDAMPRGGRLRIASANTELDSNYQRLHPEVLPGPYVMISVSDTGVGMDESTRSRIFEPFFTTKAIGKGTGLGLSIIYGIVRQSGGHIWVYSELGQGTTFKIYLPRVFAPEEKAVPQARPAPVAEPASGTILVVEDEKALAEMTQAALRDSGYTVLLAGNGEQAVKEARAHAGPIDLLLTDVILSAGINGVGLAAHLRALRPEMRVIYMSGYSDVLVKAEADVGFGAVLLEKPFSVDVLRATVRKELSRAVSVEVSAKR